MRGGARLLLAGTIVVVVGGAGLALDRVVGPREPAAAAVPAPRTGAWFCPHGEGEGWSTSVLVANPSDRDARVRVTAFGARGVAHREAFELSPGTDRTIAVPGAGTMVEYFGVRVGAAWVTESEGGVAAEACRSAAGRAWGVAGGSTERGEDSSLVVMNPFAEDAAFDVTLLTSARAPIRPGDLRGFVLPARRATVIRLSRYALGEPALAAVVEASLGAIVVGEVGSSRAGGLRAVAGDPTTAERWILPDAGGGGETVLSVANPATERSAVSARTQTADAQTLLTEITDVSVEGASAQAFGALTPEEAPSSIVIEATNRVPVFTSRRSGGPQGNGDSAAGSAVGDPQGSWLVPPAAPPGGGHQFLVLENPGEDDVAVTIRLFGRAAGDLGPVDVPGGRTIAVPLEDVVGTTPVWALAAAADGTFVAASASYEVDGRGYAVASGVPYRSGIDE